MCYLDVETEFHVLIDCPFYFDLTQPLIMAASNFDAHFNQLSAFQKYCVLVSSKNLQQMCAKICYKILTRRKGILYKS